MNLRKYIYIVLALIIAIAAFEGTDTYAARKKTKARTTQTSRKKKRTRKTTRAPKRKISTKTVPSAPVIPPDPVMDDSLTLFVNDAVIAWIPEKLNPGGLRINSVKPDSLSRTTNIALNEHFTYLPVTQQMIDSLSGHICRLMPDSIRDYKVRLTVKQRPLAYYITKVDKLPEKYRKNPVFVAEAHPWISPSKGMDRDIIALWHSHGRYYKCGNGGWTWQRPLLFQSIEDTFTMSYMLPYVVPMLENAGAYVMLPRERDTNKNEVIVDNDTNPQGNIYSQPYYKEKTGQNPWTTGELEGFIYDLPDFRDTENPFENGTYRQTKTIRNGKPSVAAWYADIPEDGEYAVYISYKSLANSTEDAHYTVNYSGGSKEFIVNQTMGGGTWIYLGTFPLERGYSDTEPIVTVSNKSDKAEGLLLTTDAVKIGGGMGNIARSDRRSDIYYDPSTPEDSQSAETETEGDETETDDEETPEETKEADKGPAPVFRTSGMPRFLEGARYWLHWAGMPESIYSPFHGTDDYKDDYTCRGHWVNYLAGGSRVMPNKEGLGIPVDMSFALHSDAGKRADDSFIGTLGIYFSQNGDSYFDGTPRINSRMLTDLVMRQICNDIRRSVEPQWTRRSMWDKSYLEARVAEVPTTLIELLSHQNFADMAYGIDPDFRFLVGRAIYKGIARFMAERKDRKLVIQPLPVKDFAIHRLKKSSYKLTWRPTHDELEETAIPEKYIILERSEGELGFHKIGETTSTHFEFKTADKNIHSFRVVAANAGGKSFPSETLSLREPDHGEKPVLIVNGFTRVSAPRRFIDGNRAGFESTEDFGVPYVKDISFTGYQMEFNRSAGDGFGRSASNYITDIIAGNTFDYPSVHGEALASLGQGFISASVGAVETGDVRLNDYKIVDLILGKQKSTTSGLNKTQIKYRAFSPELQTKLRHYSDYGGRMIISGEYVASDLYSDSNPADLEFASVVLGVAPATDSIPTKSGRLRMADGRNFHYSNTLNSKQYIVEKPDKLQAATGVYAEPIMSFSDTSETAVLITNRNKTKNAILSIPLEAFKTKEERKEVMEEILDKLKN